MRDAGMPAHIWSKGHQCVELLPLAVVQTEHVMQKPRVQERGELHSMKCQVSRLHLLYAKLEMT